MREVEKKMVAAFKRNSQNAVRCGKNTVVEAMAVYLHGHRIVWAEDKGTRRLYINMCGYGTVTTRSRINALLAGLGYKSRVYQRDFVQYISAATGDFELSTRLDEWIEY